MPSSELAVFVEAVEITHRFPFHLVTVCSSVTSLASIREISTCQASETISKSFFDMCIFTNASGELNSEVKYYGTAGASPSTNKSFGCGEIVGDCVVGCSQLWPKTDPRASLPTLHRSLQVAQSYS